MRTSTGGSEGTMLSGGSAAGDGGSEGVAGGVTDSAEGGATVVSDKTTFTDSTGRESTAGSMSCSPTSGPPYLRGGTGVSGGRKTSGSTGKEGGGV